MVQVRDRDDEPVGVFLTRRAADSTNTNSVGHQHEVSCNNQAQVSTDDTDKFRTEGRWRKTSDISSNDLLDLQCV